MRTMRDGVDLGSLPDGLISLFPSLGVNQVRGEDGVDESRLSKTRLAWDKERLGQFLVSWYGRGQGV